MCLGGEAVILFNFIYLNYPERMNNLLLVPVLHYYFFTYNLVDAPGPSSINQELFQFLKESSQGIHRTELYTKRFLSYIIFISATKRIYFNCTYGHPKKNGVCSYILNIIIIHSLLINATYWENPGCHYL